MVIGLWYTHDPNFCSLSWFWRCKEHLCPLNYVLGLWWRLEGPDCSLASWSWFGYWPMIRILTLYLDFECAKNINVLWVLIWGFGGRWRFLAGVWHLDLDWDRVRTLPCLILPLSFYFTEISESSERCHKCQLSSEKLCQDGWVGPGGWPGGWV